MLAVLVLLWVLLVPIAGMLSPPGPYGGRSKDFRYLSSTRTTLITLLGALAIAGGLIYTARTHSLTRRGQFSERFKSAVQLLASEKQEERLGGIYALEQLMSESPAEHEATVSVLSAFVRANAVVSWDENDEPTEGVATQLGGSGLWRTLPEVDAAMAVLGRRPNRGERFPIDLSRCDLRGVNFDGARFDGVILRHAWLDDARISGANLANGVLDDAFLRDSKIEYSQLQGASMRGTYLEESFIRFSNLSRADMFKTQMRAAHLYHVNLRGCLFNPYGEDALFFGIDLREARVDVSRFDGVGEADEVDLRGAEMFGEVDEYSNRVLEVLRSARIDGNTRLPDAVRRRLRGDDLAP